MKQLMVAILLGYASLAHSQTLKENVEKLVSTYAKKGYVVVYEQQMTVKSDELALAQIARGEIKPLLDARRGNKKKGVLRFETQYGNYFLAADGIYTDNGIIIRDADGHADQLRRIYRIVEEKEMSRAQRKMIKAYEKLLN